MFCKKMKRLPGVIKYKRRTAKHIKSNTKIVIKTSQRPNVPGAS